MRKSRSRRSILILAMLVTAGAVFIPACGGPASPGPPDSDCTGVTPSTNPCDTSTARLPTPDFPELPCPTPTEIAEIRREIPVRVNSDVSAGVLACRERDGSVDLTIVENQVYQSLLFLRRVRFDRPLPWTDLPVYEWVRHSIPNGIVIESSGVSSSCLKCAGPIRVAYTFYDSVRPTLYYGVQTLIIHEARHANGLPHTCGYNAEFRSFTRDRSVAEMGGFGAHYLFAYWIGQYSDQLPVVREYYAKHAAQLLGGGSFCCECGRRSTTLLARLFGGPERGRAGYDPIPNPGGCF